MSTLNQSIPLVGIPTWDQASSKHAQNEVMDALESFVFQYEPTSNEYEGEIEEWRNHLQGVINLAYRAGRNGVLLEQIKQHMN